MEFLSTSRRFTLLLYIFIFLSFHYLFLNPCQDLKCPNINRPKWTNFLSSIKPFAQKIKISNFSNPFKKLNKSPILNICSNHLISDNQRTSLPLKAAISWPSYKGPFKIEREWMKTTTTMARSYTLINKVHMQMHFFNRAKSIKTLSARTSPNQHNQKSRSSQNHSKSKTTKIQVPPVQNLSAKHSKTNWPSIKYFRNDRRRKYLSTDWKVHHNKFIAFKKFKLFNGIW